MPMADMSLKPLGISEYAMPVARGALFDHKSEVSRAVVFEDSPHFSAQIVKITHLFDVKSALVASTLETSGPGSGRASGASQAMQRKAAEPGTAIASALRQQSEYLNESKRSAPRKRSGTRCVLTHRVDKRVPLRCVRGVQLVATGNGGDTG